MNTLKLTLVITLAAATACAAPEGGTQAAGEAAGEAVESRMSQQPEIKIEHKESEQQVDVTVGGELFTSYIYWDKLKKPVFYPLMSADNRMVTRGYPYRTIAGERVDHPHHLGHWMNYGDVNGNDFWGNSPAVDPSRHPYGEIRHRSVDRISQGAGVAELEVSMDWVGPEGEKILGEHDRVIFRASGEMRILDRVITLTAGEQDVVFGDTKEGMFAVRVTRGLEEPADRPIKYADAQGNVTEVEKLDNTGVDGSYLSAAGLVDERQVWGTRSRWCILRGTLDSKPVTVAIFDHPDNPAYPTYWHARGYGLFAANPFGWNTFTEGAKELNYTIAAGESAVMRWRILIADRGLDSLETEMLFQQWLEDMKQ